MGFHQKFSCLAVLLVSLAILGLPPRADADFYIDGELVRQAQGDRFIQTHSRRSIGEAARIANEMYARGFVNAAVFSSRNGWYAVVVGLFAPDEQGQFTYLKRSGKIPADSQLTPGQGYIALTYLAAADPQRTGNAQAGRRSQGADRGENSSSRSGTSIYPTDRDIGIAVERVVRGRIAQLDALAGQCGQVSRTNNPLNAYACLLGGFGLVGSHNFSFRVNSVFIDECVRANDGVYCKYRVDADVHGSGVMTEMSQLADALLLAPGWNYAKFVRRAGRWDLDQPYTSCSLGNGRVSCR